MGADFEKDLTKYSTLEYVRAISSTGESILISKADLAKVLTELIGTASISQNGLMSSANVRKMGVRVKPAGVGKYYKFSKMEAKSYQMLLFNITEIPAPTWSSVKSSRITLSGGTDSNTGIPTLTAYYIGGTPLVKLYKDADNNLYFCCTRQYGSHILVEGCDDYPLALELVSSVPELTEIPIT